MAFKLGMQAVLNYKVGGQGGAGSWVPLTNCRDASTTGETGTADVTTRANQGWRAEAATLRQLGLEFEMVWDTTDPGMLAIHTAWITNAIIGFQFLDGTSGKGVQADFMISDFSVSQPLEEAITVSVSASVTLSDTPPSLIGFS
jgi:hypothetical protein